MNCRFKFWVSKALEEAAGWQGSLSKLQHSGLPSAGAGHMRNVRIASYQTYSSIPVD